MHWALPNESHLHKPLSRACAGFNCVLPPCTGALPCTALFCYSDSCFVLSFCSAASASSGTA
eukprot:scaffold113075_cov21-Tisochrysis_lutea.AAC.1